MQTTTVLSTNRSYQISYHGSHGCGSKVPTKKRDKDARRCQWLPKETVEQPKKKLSELSFASTKKSTNASYKGAGKPFDILSGRTEAMARNALVHQEVHKQNLSKAGRQETNRRPYAPCTTGATYLRRR